MRYIDLNLQKYRILKFVYLSFYILNRIYERMEKNMQNFTQNKNKLLLTVSRSYRVVVFSFNTTMIGSYVLFAGIT